MMETLGSKLPKEIKRVREMRDQFKSLRGVPGVTVDFQILMMEAEIDRAVQALADGDIVAMIQSCQCLKGWENDQSS